MKNYSIYIIVAAAVAILSSCGKTVVSGRFETVPSEKVVVAKTVEGTQMRTLDSIKIAKDGSFKYKAPIAKGQPDFVYFYYGEKKVASLALEAGDKVSVVCDTLGSWSVEGSEASAQLLRWENDYAAFVSKDRITAKDYIGFYRAGLRYVMANSKTIACVPAMFAKVGNVPLFSQSSDVLLFENVADSLETVYPDSKYVKAIRTEAVKRRQQLNLDNMVKAASEASYIDLNFDGIDGQTVSLSSLAEKNTTLLVFWDASDAGNKMFNKEVLEPIYKKYSSRGLKIYAVGLGADKASWAMVVREQNLPWVNVCDPYARSVSAYNVQQIPSVIMLHKGEIYHPSGASNGDLATEIAKILK